MKVIKVLHVITTLHAGGVEKLMVELLPLINGKGIQADLMVFNGTRTFFFDKLEEAGIKIFAGDPGTSVYSPLNIVKLRKLMGDYDIIHTHNSSPQIFASISSLGSSACLVTTEHNTFNRRRQNKVLSRLDRWIYRRYHKITCVSKEVEHKLREHIGPSRARDIVTIYNGVDIEPFRLAKASEELNVYRQAHGDVKLLMMVAGFRKQKDQETLIKAMAYLPENYHLMFVGNGEMQQVCRSWVHDLGLEDRVVFMGRRNDVAELLKGADVSILSTHYEGFGLAVIESMAVGVPMILTDVDTLREVAGDAAIFVRPGDSVRLAEEVRNVVENPELRKRLIDKGQRRADRFRLETMAKGYVELYRNIIRKRRDPRGQ